MASMKPLRWLHGEVKTPPMTSGARKELGFLLRLLQDERHEMKKIGKGWVEGNAQELLGLTDADAAYVQTKVALTQAVRARRLALGRSQASMAKALGTSQSRFSFIEKGDPSVTIDLALRALFETGMDVRGVAAVMVGKTGQKTPSAT